MKELIFILPHTCNLEARKVSVFISSHSKYFIIKFLKKLLKLNFEKYTLKLSARGNIYIWFW